MLLYLYQVFSETLFLPFVKSWEVSLRSKIANRKVRSLIFVTFRVKFSHNGENITSYCFYEVLPDPFLLRRSWPILL